jgi:hypothetical protein
MSRRAGLTTTRDDNFNSQLTEHPLVSAFESQVRWMKIVRKFILVHKRSDLISSAGTQRPLQIFNIFRPFVQWWNLRQMDTYVGNILEARFASRNTRGKKKHVIDLALETYLKENNVDETSKLDPKFKDAALRNIKIFIFAGHEAVHRYATATINSVNTLRHLLDCEKNARRSLVWIWTRRVT